MKTSIFRSSSYKAYLLKIFGPKQKTRQGNKTAAADFIGCRPSFLSRVLYADANLSLEQAYKLAQFLALEDIEVEYFLLLIQCDRAGTPELKKHFKAKRKAFLQTHDKIGKRLKSEKKLSIESSAEYYSSWRPAAVHAAVTIPKLQSYDQLQNHFRFSPQEMNRILSLLEKIGAIRRDGEQISAEPFHVHLDSQSPYIGSHLANWRFKALESYDSNNPTNFNYSGVASVSHDDKKKVRELLMESLDQISKIVEESEEQTLIALNFDLFEP